MLLTLLLRAVDSRVFWIGRSGSGCDTGRMMSASAGQTKKSPIESGIKNVNLICDTRTAIHTRLSSISDNGHTTDEGWKPRGHYLAESEQRNDDFNGDDPRK